MRYQRVQSTTSLTFIAPLTLLAALFAGDPALGQVDSYGNTKDRYYHQVSAAQPAAPVGYSYNHYLFSWEEDLSFANVGTVRVDRPDGGTVSYPASGGRFATFFGPWFGAEAELDAALPAGNYHFSMSGGSFGPQSGVVDQPDFNAWNDVPYVLNFDDVQAASPGQDLVVDFNDWTPDPRTTPDRSPIFWELFNRSANESVIGGFLFPGDESEFTIPGALLAPATYELSIIFSARIEEFPAGFGAALGTTAFDTTTRLDFVVTPEPSGLVGLLSLVGILTAARRRS